MAADPPPSSPGPSRPAAPEGMVALGAALGATIWWCERLFEVTGAWVPSVPEAAVRVHVAELSRVLGDHAGALRRHLPRPAPVDPEGWVAPPGAGPGVVAALGAPPTSVARLAGLHRVLVPRLLVAWGPTAGPGSPSGRGVARTVGHLRSDLLELWLDGEGLLQALVDAAPAAAGAAAATVAELEAALARAGGLVGGGTPSLPG